MWKRRLNRWMTVRPSDSTLSRRDTTIVRDPRQLMSLWLESPLEGWVRLRPVTFWRSLAIVTEISSKFLFLIVLGMPWITKCNHLLMG